MTEHKRVYQEKASQYQRLVAREDYQGNLLPAILDIISLDGLDILDLGSGTGRLAVLSAPLVKNLYAFDLSPHMLRIALDHLRTGDSEDWLVGAADHRHLPLPNQSVDLVMSGWSLCYLVVWEAEKWESELEKGLTEITRVLRPNSMTIIIETLGTGRTHPEPPEKLKIYFEYLKKKGFKDKWIRTDYRFESREEAEDLTEFFFGEDMLGQVQSGSNPILPECTGIWWLNNK